MLLRQLLRTSNSLASFSSPLRQLRTSSVDFNITWRLANGYPRHWTERGVLTDGPDFSYEDGRPTPYTNGQRARLLMHKQNTEKILHLLDAIKWAKAKHAARLNEEKKSQQAILDRKLKPKGEKLLCPKSTGENLRDS